MNTTEKGLNLLYHFEDKKLKAYQCSAGIWTIAVGVTRYPNGATVKEGDTVTSEEADRLTLATLVKYEQAVTKGLRVNLTCYQFDSLVLFTYNNGIGAFEKSTLLKKVNAGAPIDEIEAEFMKWTKYTDPVTKKKLVSRGLVRRRKAEFHLYKTGEVNYFL